MPKSITTIEEFAFESCDSLTQLDLSGVANIPDEKVSPYRKTVAKASKIE